MVDVPSGVTAVTVLRERLRGAHANLIGKAQILVDIAERFGQALPSGQARDDFGSVFKNWLDEFDQHLDALQRLYRAADVAAESGRTGDADAAFTKAVEDYYRAAETMKSTLEGLD